MKFLTIIVLCIVLLFSMLGYSQFKTTTIEQIKDWNYIGKTVIVEGYTHRTLRLILTNCAIRIDLYSPIKCEKQCIFLIGNVKWIPPHRGEMNNHIRVKGIVVTIDPKEIYKNMTGFYYYPIFAIDVMSYGLALSEKNYRRERGKE